MRWEDEGIVIATKRYGDKYAILSLFTKGHGKYRGLVRLTKGKSYEVQISNVLHVEWSGRLPINLGFFKCELIESVFPYFFHDRLKNVAVMSFSSILECILPENEAQHSLYDNFKHFINVMKCEGRLWQSYYINLELLLLEKLGFKLDLSKCSATGSREDLLFISPKTGRSVSGSAGEYYRDKLLPLPQMISDVHNNNLKESYSLQEFQLGLKVLGYFLDKYLFSQFGMKVPEARKLLLAQ